MLGFWYPSSQLSPTISFSGTFSIVPGLRCHFRERQMRPSRFTFSSISRAVVALEKERRDDGYLTSDTDAKYHGNCRERRRDDASPYLSPARGAELDVVGGDEEEEGRGGKEETNKNKNRHILYRPGISMSFSRDTNEFITTVHVLVTFLPCLLVKLMNLLYPKSTIHPIHSKTSNNKQETTKKQTRRTEEKYTTRGLELNE